MAIEALEAVLFILLFGIDAYAYGNINEIRRILQNKQGSSSQVTHIESTSRVKEVATATKEEPKVAKVIEYDDVKHEQSIQESRINEIEERLSSIQAMPANQISEQELDQIEERFTDRFTHIEETVSELKENDSKTTELLEKIEKKLDSTNSDALEERIYELEESTKAKMKASDEKTSKTLKKIEDKLDAIEKQGGSNKKLDKQLKAINKGIEAQNTRISKLGREVSAIAGAADITRRELIERIDESASGVEKRTGARIDSLVKTSKQTDERVKKVNKAVAETGTKFEKRVKIVEKRITSGKPVARKPAKKATVGSSTYKKTIVTTTEKAAAPKTAATASTSTYKKTVVKKTSGTSAKKTGKQGGKKGTTVKKTVVKKTSGKKPAKSSTKSSKVYEKTVKTIVKKSEKNAAPKPVEEKPKFEKTIKETTVTVSNTPTNTN